MGALEIYTYGSGAFIGQVLEVVKLLISGGMVLGLLKVFAIVGFLMMIVMSSLKLLNMNASENITAADPVASLSAYGFVILIQRAFYAAVAVYLLLNPLFTANVLVIDRMNANNNRAVTGVPYPLAYAAHASSLIGDTIGQHLDDYLSPVDAVKIRNGGLAIGPRALNEIFNFMPPLMTDSGDATIKGMITDWYERCIYYNLGSVDSGTSQAAGLKALSTSTDLLSESAFNAYPFNSLQTMLDDQTSCNNAQTVIKQRWLDSNTFNRWITSESARVFGVKDDDPALISTVFELIDRYFPDSVLGSQDKLLQLATLNVAYPALVNFQSRYGLMTTTDVAQRQQGNAWLEMARMAPKTLMMIRQLAEGGVYLLMAFLPAFFVLSGIGAVVKYVKMVFWLALWVPFFVLLNCFADMAVAKAVESVSTCMSGTCTTDLNFATLDKLRTETAQILGYIGVLSLSVPGLAWGALKGGEAALGGAVGALSGAASASAAGSAGASGWNKNVTDQTDSPMAPSTISQGQWQKRTEYGAMDIQATNSRSVSDWKKTLFAESQNRTGISTDRKIGENNARDIFGGNAITQATANKTGLDIGSGIGWRDPKNAYEKGLNKAEREEAIGHAQIDWTNNMAAQLQKTNPSMSPEAAHHKAQRMMGEMDFTLTGKGTYMAAMKEGAARRMSPTDALMSGTIVDKQLAMGSGIERGNQLNKANVPVSMAGAVDGAGKAGQDIGKIVTAGQSLRSAGQAINDENIKGNVRDSSAGAAGLDLAKGEMAKRTLAEIPYIDLVQSGVTREKRNVADNQVKQEMVDAYVATYGGSQANAFKQLARFDYADQKANVEYFNGNPEGLKDFQKMARGLNHGDMLGTIQAAREIGLSGKELKQMSAHLGAQGTIGVMQAIQAGRLDKEALRDTGFMEKARNYFNTPQMMSSAQNGDTKIPASLFNKDGTMDSRMTALWVTSMAQAEGQMIERKSQGSDYSRANAGARGSVGAHTPSVPGGIFSAGGEIYAGGEVGADSRDMRTYNQNLAKYQRIADRGAAVAQSTEGRAEDRIAAGARSIASDTQREFASTQHSLQTERHGAGKLAVGNNARSVVNYNSPTPSAVDPKYKNWVGDSITGKK